MDPPSVAAGHAHDLHVAEEDDRGGQEEREGGHEEGVGGAAGPVHGAAEHGAHVVHRAPAHQGGAAGESRLNPDPEDDCPGPPSCAAWAVAQAVHYGVVAVQSDGS